MWIEQVLGIELYFTRTLGEFVLKSFKAVIVHIEF